MAVGKCQESFEGKDSAKAAFCWVNVLFNYFRPKGWCFLEQDYLY